MQHFGPEPRRRIRRLYGINMTTYALITMIERNGKSLNDDRGFTFPKQRLYEDEALLCFESWRRNGGWLKDLPIYVFCPTNNTISAETRAELEKLNVVYIEEYRKETESFLSGFWNVPLCGMLFEERLSEDVLIHTDLDMNLIQPLPKEMLDSVLEKNDVICGQYDDVSALDQRKIGEDWVNPMDTGFLISARTSGFYKFFYENLMDLTATGGDERWKKNCSDFPSWFLEEYVIDKAVNEGTFPIRPVQKYQLGEGYAKIGEFSDEELKKVYFWHEHILYEEKYDKIRQKIEFFKRTGKKP